MALIWSPGGTGAPARGGEKIVLCFRRSGPEGGPVFGGQGEQMKYGFHKNLLEGTYDPGKKGPAADGRPPVIL